MRDIISEPRCRARFARLLAELDFHLLCRLPFARGRVLAYIGIGRTTEGDFLSSDDIELLVTIIELRGDRH